MDITGVTETNPNQPIAWEQFPRAIGWALSIVKDEDTARDIAIDTLEEMAEQGYGPKLLYRRVQWRALDHLRRGRIHLVDVELERLASTDPTPEQLLEAKRTRQRVCERIGSEALSILELSAEQSDDETAATLGITKPALRKARSRARNKLLGV